MQGSYPNTGFRLFYSAGNPAQAESPRNVCESQFAGGKSWMQAGYRQDQEGVSAMTRGVPVLDPKVHLVGATPVALAQALFRNKNPALRPARVRQAVVSDEVAIEKPAADEAGDSVPHLGEGS